MFDLILIGVGFFLIGLLFGIYVGINDKLENKFYIFEK